jgi:hypothetical protein
VDSIVQPRGWDARNECETLCRSHAPKSQRHGVDVTSAGGEEVDRVRESVFFGQQ